MLDDLVVHASKPATPFRSLTEQEMGSLEKVYSVPVEQPKFVVSFSYSLHKHRVRGIRTALSSAVEIIWVEVATERHRRSNAKETVGFHCSDVRPKKVFAFFCLLQLTHVARNSPRNPPRIARTPSAP